MKTKYRNPKVVEKPRQQTPEVNNKLQYFYLNKLLYNSKKNYWKMAKILNDRKQFQNPAIEFSHSCFEDISQTAKHLLRKCQQCESCGL